VTCSEQLSDRAVRVGDALIVDRFIDEPRCRSWPDRVDHVPEALELVREVEVEGALGVAGALDDVLDPVAAYP
jgi:hypothetical protein